MKKRLLSLALALVMVLALAAPALAAEVEGDPVPTWSYTCVVEPQYDGIFASFSEGLIGAKKDGKWGFIDTEGNVAIPFEYDIAYSFSEGLAIVGQATKNGEKTYYRLGFIDKENHLTWFEQNASEDDFKPIYLPEDDTNNYFFSCGYVAFVIYAETGEAWGIGGYGETRLFGTDGKEKFGGADDNIDFGWEPIRLPVTENISAGFGMILNVQTGEKRVAIGDYDGTEIIDGKELSFMSVATPFNQGLAVAEFTSWSTTLDDNTDDTVEYFGVVDVNGNLVIPPKYTNYMWNGSVSYTVFDQGTGLASMADEAGKWGALNKQGETVIPFTYDSLQTFRCGLAAFKKDGKYKCF